MKAVVMAGGLSSRFGGGEKPMALLRGKPLIGWVVDALQRGFAGPVSVAVSPRTPQTARWARARGFEVIETPGRGFVEDAALAARRLGLPLLVVAADLPLLPPEQVAGVIRHYAETHRPLSVWTPAGRGDGWVQEGLYSAPDARVVERERGCVGGLVPVGLNLWAPGREERRMAKDCRLSLNVNSRPDLLQARERLDRIGD